MRWNLEGRLLLISPCLITIYDCRRLGELVYPNYLSLLYILLDLFLLSDCCDLFLSLSYVRAFENLNFFFMKLYHVKLNNECSNVKFGGACKKCIKFGLEI